MTEGTGRRHSGSLQNFCLKKMRTRKRGHCVGCDSGLLDRGIGGAPISVFWFSLWYYKCTTGLPGLYVFSVFSVTARCQFRGLVRASACNVQRIGTSSHDARILLEQAAQRNVSVSTWAKEAITEECVMTTECVKGQLNC